MRTALLTLMLLLAWPVAALDEEVAIPSPTSMTHSGADDAPASSPTTYPDADGFKRRSMLVVAGLAEGGLDKWRKGYFKGGDPGKYLPGHAMAKLLLNLDDVEARKFMNDDRSYKEHYHFAAVNWGRFYPLFGEVVLTEQTRKEFIDFGFRYGSYLSPRGTENHKTMWMTTVNVLPHYTDKGLSHRSKEETLKRGKEALRDYVKGLYWAGQGEWDSSTYLMFDVNGMLNIYDFARDEETRLLAKAALDWYVAGYALKYRDGVYTAPNQRGFAKGPHESIADQSGYVWFGSNARVTPEQTRDWRYAMHAITSGYRPNKVLHNIATKALPELPAEFHNTKPNYWYGQGIAPKAGVYHEVVHVAKNFTMGSLLDGHGGQITRFQLVVETDGGGVVLTAGNPRKSDHTGKKTGLGFTDGTGRYSQFAQMGPVVVCMSNAPEDDKDAHFTYLMLPDDVEVKTSEGVHWFRIGEVSVLVHPFGGKSSIVKSEPDRKGRVTRYLRVDGARSGFAMIASDDGFRGTGASSSDWLDASKYGDELSLKVGRGSATMQIKYNPDPDGDMHGSRAAHVTVGDKKQTLDGWPIYGGPYIEQRDGTLKVNDGKDGFIVEFSGPLPVYKALK